MTGQGEAAGQVPRMVGLQEESAALPGRALPLVRGGYEIPLASTAAAGGEGGGGEGGAAAAFVLRWSGLM